MATWAVYGALQSSGTLQLNATDHIWLTGTSFSNNVVAGTYQDGTHISDSNDVQRDTASPINNVKYVTSSTASLNGASAVALSSISQTYVSFKFVFSDVGSVATSAAKFYAYDGVTDTTALIGVDLQAAEQGNSTWTAANGSGSALSLANQGASTTHNFYVILSASPTSPGAKSGSVKLTITYA